MQPKTSYASLSCPVDTALAVWASQGQYDAIVAIGTVHRTPPPYLPLSTCLFSLNVW